MVNFAALSGRLSFVITSLTPFRSANVLSSRTYSMFPSYYVKPTFKKEEQETLIQSGEALNIAHVPILPAQTNETASEFHDPAISLFTNYIMRQGKKVLARQLLEKAFANIKREQIKRYNGAKPEERDTVELDPIKIFHKAIENATPVMELMKMKRGGVVYQVPIPVREKRKRFLAMNWLIQAGKDKHRKLHFPEILAKELLDAAYNQGRVVKRKQDLHKQCEANRAYAHFRWA